MTRNTLLPLLLITVALLGQLRPSHAQVPSADSLLRIINSNIGLDKEKVTQLVFPSRIEKYRGGFDPENFVQEIYENILYLQPLTEFVGSNLHIITEDGANYSINVHYENNGSIYRSTYIYLISDAIVPPRTLIPVPGILTAATTLPQNTVQPSMPIPIVKDSTMAKILREKGFIVNRSGVRYKNLSFQVTGIYYHANKIYVKCNVTNDTNIPYEFDYIGFQVQTRKRQKATTSNTEELTPLDTYYEATSITSKREISCVFVFNKFTIGSNNILAISIVEKDGGRNMILNITDDILLQAKNI